MSRTPKELREEIFQKLIQYHARQSRIKKEKKKETYKNEIWSKGV